MKIKNIICFILGIISGILLVSALFIVCVEAIAFNRNFYNSEYDKLSTHISVGVDQNTLKNATDILLDYLQQKRPDLNYSININSNNTEYYTDREKNHMVDVLKLNQNALTFMRTALLIGTIFGAMSLFIAGNKKYLSPKGIFYGILSVLAAFVLIGAYISLDFNSFWVKFHHLFFTNELWILDPAQSLMIRMFDSTFFFDMCALILTLFLSITCASLCALFIIYRKLYKKWIINRR